MSAPVVRLGDRMLDGLRRLLPSPVKRALKAVWDPSRRFGVRAALRESAHDAGAMVRWRSPGAETAAPPRVSVVVVSCGALDYTRLCLERLLVNTSPVTSEIIVVDNGSRDGSAEYLRGLAKGIERLTVVLNSDNRGFARAVNQGLRAALGERLVIMNNDVAVPPGWLESLFAPLESPDVALAVPTTNASANESRIDCDYGSLREMEAFATARAASLRGRSFDIPVAAMYCVALGSSTLERLGYLDERFEIGLFEDDDYSRRAREAGLRVVCAESAFVHHFGQATFNRMPGDEYRALFDANRRRFEEKWGEPWEGHRHRGE